MEIRQIAAPWKCAGQSCAYASLRPSVQLLANDISGGGGAETRESRPSICARTGRKGMSVLMRDAPAGAPSKRLSSRLRRQAVDRAIVGSESPSSLRACLREAIVRPSDGRSVAHAAS